MSAEKGARGIRMRAFNAVMIAVTLVLACLLLYNIYLTTQEYRQLQDGAERYMQAQQDAALLQSGSDYLTQEVRAFTVTQDTNHVRLYFEEAEVTRSRDRAIEHIRETMESGPSLNYLDQAMAESVELMEREYQAMRLVLEATENDLTAWPEILSQTALTPEEEALSPAEKIALAQSMVFDEVYQGYKDRIASDVQRCTEALIEQTRESHAASSEQVLRKLQTQQLLTLALLAAALLTVILTSLLIIRPLERAVASVRADEPMPISGAYELRFLEKNYNEMFSRTQQNQQKLSYEATHDPLTGLSNRKAYETKLAECEGQDIALILVDVDDFKGVNDTWGHATGDLVLKRVAEVLTLCFRSEDAVCRIGGDEFAVVMMHVNSSLSQLVRNKCRRINETMAAGTKGVPSATLSIGVAFSDREKPSGTLFQDADRALYAVKEAGRNGCAIYTGDEEALNPAESPRQITPIDPKEDPSC